MKIETDHVQQCLYIVTSAFFVMTSLVLPWIQTAGSVTTSTASLFYTLCTTNNKWDPFLSSLHATVTQWWLKLFNPGLAGHLGLILLSRNWSPSVALFFRCRNGECYVLGDQIQCLCGGIYSGKYCETVDLNSVQYAIIGSVVIFQWTRPPRFVFVQYHPVPSLGTRLLPNSGSRRNHLLLLAKVITSIHIAREKTASGERS